MSNAIPPLVSSSPPPMLPEDDEEDDFGDFAAANDYSYDDSLSLPTTPQRIVDLTPPIITYPNLSETSTTDEEIKENCNHQVEFKDNASQDSVLSIVTSDSGLSEIHSSSSDDIIPEIEITERGIADGGNDSSVIIPEINLELTKDFLDVRNNDESKEITDKRKIDLEICDSVTHSSSKIENFYSDITIVENLPENSFDNFQNAECDSIVNKTVVENICENRFENVQDVNSACDFVNTVQPVQDVNRLEFPEKINSENDVEEKKLVSDLKDEILITEVVKTDDFVSDSKDEILNTEVVKSNDPVELISSDRIQNSFDDDNDDDEFVEFKSHVDDEVDDKFETFQPTNIQVENDDDDDDDFGDFTECQNEEFDDFADFSTAPVEVHQKVEENIEIDDNNEQSEIINLFSKKPNRDESEKLSLMVREIFKQAFPPLLESENHLTDFHTELSSMPDLVQNSKIWQRLDDVENLKPLTFRWENATTYQKYLQTINMDTRNILYGSNLSMPRFAANLGGTPLEPLKPTPAAVITSPTPQSNIEQSIKTESNDFVANKTEVINHHQSVLPPQFNWNNSGDGLLNSIQYTPNNSGSMLLNLEELINSLNTTTNVHNDDTSRPSDDDGVLMSTEGMTTTLSDTNDKETVLNIDAWEYWTQCSNKEIETPTKQDDIPNMTMNSLENVPPTVNVQTETEKELNKDIESVKSLNFTEIPDIPINNKIEATNDVTTTTPPSCIENESPDDDDEFSDFYSVVQPPTVQSFPSVVFPTPMNLRETHISTPPTVSNPIEAPAWLQPTVVTPELTRKPKKLDEIKSTVVEDDFTDFQFAENIQSTVTNTPIIAPLSTNLLEPIKVETIVKPSLEINWPDPGISEDDLQRLSNLRIEKEEIKNEQPPIEVQQTFDTKNDQLRHETLPCIETVKEKNETKMEQVDDGWSDFVSVTNVVVPPTVTSSDIFSDFQSVQSIPIVTNCSNSNISSSKNYNPNSVFPSNFAISSNNKQSNFQPSQTASISTISSKNFKSTSDFLPNNATTSSSSKNFNPNSNFQSIQISSNSTIASSKNFSSNYHPPQSGPISTISSKNFNHSDFPIASQQQQQPPPPPPNYNNFHNDFLAPQQIVRNNDKSNDDDWSDFVSNRDSMNQYTNGWNPVKQRSTTTITNWTESPNFPSWNAPSSFTPNIITNPGHFESSSKYFQNSNYYHHPTMMMSPASLTTTNNNNNNNNTVSSSCSSSTVKPVCITTKTHTTTHTTLQTMKGKNSVATISSIPDLDFMVPKSIMRTKTMKK